MSIYKRTILLVDDHPIFRKGVREVIHQKTELSVVAEADNGLSAITLSQIHQPNIALVDLALPDMNGFDLIHKIKKLSPATLFVVMTLYNDRILIDNAITLGIVGYVLKSDGVDVLTDCLDKLTSDTVFLSPSVSRLQPEKPTINNENPNWLSELSQREMSVLSAIANNSTSREIANQLNLSVRTVQNHRARIVKKLNIQGNNGLFSFALEHRNTILRSIGKL